MNPFSTIADGYARHRPPVHGEILTRALGAHRFRRAIDVGCGSGLSTRALANWAVERIGIEPVEAMVEAARTVDPSATFLTGSAEAVPCPDHCCDLITAAGALNYSDPALFFPEALRLLSPHGTLLIYDFATGSREASAPGSEWLARFIERYPWAPSEARELNPDLLAAQATGLFAAARAEEFSVRLTLTRDFFLEYMLTETNVAYAVRRGASLDEIRAWCAESLAADWPADEATVLFPAYYVLFHPAP